MSSNTNEIGYLATPSSIGAYLRVVSNSSIYSTNSCPFANSTTREDKPRSSKLNYIAYRFTN